MRRLMSLAAVCVLSASAVQAEVSFRPASTTPDANYKAISSPEGRVFVASQDLFFGEEVANVASQRDGQMLTFTVADDVAASLRGVDRLAIVADGSIIGAPNVRLNGNTVSLSGMNKAAGAHVANVLASTNADPDAGVLTVVSKVDAVNPGDTFTVDVYANGFADVRAYQFKVNATGAQSGNLALVDLAVDTERGDYVFAGQEVLPAADKTRYFFAGSVGLAGGTSVSEPAYLGSATFQAPENGEAIYVNIDTGQHTFLRASQADVVSYRIGAPVVIGGTNARIGTGTSRTK